MILSILLTAIMSFASLVLKKSKLVSMFFFVLMWLLFGWNYWNGDYDAYEKLYNFPIIELDTNKYEWGYAGLMFLFNKLGFEFQDFFIAISFISLFLLFNFVVRYSIYPALFSVLFFFVYFPLNYVLLRNFVAFTIVLQGLIFIINDHKYKVVIFLLFVFVASFFHGTSLFYLCLIICLYKKRINIVFTSFVVFFITLIYIYFGSYITNVFFESSGRGEIYESSFNVFVVNTFLQIINLLVIKYFYDTSLTLKCKSVMKNSFDTVIMNVNILLLFVIPLYYSYSIAIRLFWNISFVNVIFMTNIYICCNEYKRKIVLLLFIVFYLLFFFMYMIAPFIDDTLFSLYRYNLIFK